MQADRHGRRRDRRKLRQRQREQGQPRRRASVMTIDSTAAKIGRSMKNRENTAGSALLPGWSAACRSPWRGATRPDDRHVHRSGSTFGAPADALRAAHDDALAGFRPSR